MTTLQGIADRVAGGGALTDEEAHLLFATHDLIALGMMADGVRQQLHGKTTTFVRVFEVHAEAVPQALPSGVVAGEMRIVGRPASAEAAYAAVAAVRRLADATPLTGFSLADLAGLAASDRELYRRLKEAGLDAVADVPLDDFDSPAAPVADAVDAGLSVPRLTVMRVTKDPVALFRQVMALQQATGAFRAFAPLPRIMSIAEPTTGYDDVKSVALARLMVRRIPTIQIDWALYGPKLAQVALMVGADDVDGVAAHETGALGRRRSALEEVRRNIHAAALQPIERNGRFEPVGSAP